MSNLSFKYDVSMILSTYDSDKFINNYYNNIIDLIKFSKIQLIHVLNDPTTKELFFKDKFLELQKKERGEKFQYKFLIVKRESLYSSWNKAIELSDSMVITISNVDDIRYPTGFKAQIAELKIADKMLLVSGKLHIRTPDELIINNSKKTKITKNDLYSGMYIGPAFMWTNPKFFGLNQIYFDEQFYVAGDFDFQIRFASIGDIRFLEEVLGEYYVANTGLSTGSIFQLIEGQAIYQRYNVKDKKAFFFPNIFFKNKYSIFFLKIDGVKFSLEEKFCNFENIRKINSIRKKSRISYLYDILFVIKLMIKKFVLLRR